MSSFFDTYQTEVFAVFSLVMIYMLWRHWLRYWHLGFGTELVFKHEDGTVWVVSRLFYSPSHHHGIQNCAQLTSVDGVSMVFPSGGDFVKWFKDHKPKRAIQQRWVVINPGGYEVAANMLPGFITSHIPSYWNPNISSGGTVRDWRVKTGMGWCNKTGQHYSTSRLSHQAIMSAYGFSY